MASTVQKKYTVNLSNDFVTYYNNIINNGGTTGEPILAIQMTIGGFSLIFSSGINNFEITLPDLPNSGFVSAYLIYEESGDDISLTGELDIVYQFNSEERVISSFDIEILGITATDFSTE